MSNFVKQFMIGQSGGNKGLPFGSGLEQLTKDTNGIHRARIYGVAGPEKSGKSTFVDYSFILQPYLYCLENHIKINWDYYSFELDRISKEFDWTAYFLNYDYGISQILLSPGITKDNKNFVELSPDLLRGYVVDDKENTIILPQDIVTKVQEIYRNRIKPLFGEYDEKGIQLKKGLINFKEGRENPTGVYKDIIKIAESEGKVIKNNKNEPVSFIPNNPNSYRIIVIDHIRKLNPERGFTMKQTIDKMSEYMVILRNALGYTFVPILHTNRNLSSTDKLSYFKGDIYPSSVDLKDSGNLGEDCNYLITTFNPNDDQYNLKEHFGFKIRDTKGNILYPNFKSIHLVSSRHGMFPRHYKINMFGNIKKFEKI